MFVDRQGTQADFTARVPGLSECDKKRPALIELWKRRNGFKDRWTLLRELMRYSNPQNLNHDLAQNDVSFAYSRASWFCSAGLRLYFSFVSLKYFSHSSVFPSSL